MEPLSMGYKWYTFKLYLDENIVEIYNQDELLKRVTVIFDSDIEKILKRGGSDITGFFENILRETKL